MKKPVVLAGLVAIVVGCLLASAPGKDDNKSAPAASPFKGRIIVVGTGTDPEVVTVLEDVKIQRLGERSFLVGTGVHYGDPNDWIKGQVEWVAIDNVDSITEFSSIDEYKKTPGPNAIIRQANN